MSLVSFAVRVLPLTLIRGQIQSRFIRSFLFYVPYVTLAVMTFPAIVEATQLPLAGALALAVADRVLMLENAVYAILSPEGFASILWKDAQRHEEACGVMKLTAPDLLGLGVIDEIIPEPEGGAHLSPRAVLGEVDRCLSRHLAELLRQSGAALAEGRYQKFRRMGANIQKEDP